MAHTNKLNTYRIIGLISLFTLLIAALVLTKTPTTNAAVTTQVPRSMYLWTSAFDNHSLDYIKTYLTTNNISTVIASGSNKTAFNQLAAAMAAQGKKTELLLGSNSILTNTNQVAYFDTLFNGIDVKNVSALHLDVEPQALADYQARKEYYLNLYVKLLKTAKTYATQKGIKLNVSIPVYWPTTTLKEIYKQADTVYLMAYEITNLDSLERRTREEMAFGKEKNVLALRTNDFATRTALETYLVSAATKLGASRVAIHDFTRSVNLPQ